MAVDKETAVELAEQMKAPYCDLCGKQLNVSQAEASDVLLMMRMLGIWSSCDDCSPGTLNAAGIDRLSVLFRELGCFEEDPQPRRRRRREK